MAAWYSAKSANLMNVDTGTKENACSSQGRSSACDSSRDTQSSSMRSRRRGPSLVITTSLRSSTVPFIHPSASSPGVSGAALPVSPEAEPSRPVRRSACRARPILLSRESPVRASTQSGSVRSMAPASSTNRAKGFSSPRRRGMGAARAAARRLVMSSTRKGWRKTWPTLTGSGARTTERRRRRRAAAGQIPTSGSRSIRRSPR